MIDALDSKPNNNDHKDASELDPNPVMVPPLQQQQEFAKAEAGKESPIINKLTQDETEHNPANPIFRTR